MTETNCCRIDQMSDKHETSIKVNVKQKKKKKKKLANSCQPGHGEFCRIFYIFPTPKPCPAVFDNNRIIHSSDFSNSFIYLPPVRSFNSFIRYPIKTFSNVSVEPVFVLKKKEKKKLPIPARWRWWSRSSIRCR